MCQARMGHNNWFGSRTEMRWLLVEAGHTVARFGP
jgi:hypothetical protein